MSSENDKLSKNSSSDENSTESRGRLENTTTRKNYDSRSIYKSNIKKAQSFKKLDRPNIKANLPKRSGSMNYGLNRPVNLTPVSSNTSSKMSSNSHSTSLNNLLSKLEFFKIIQAKKNGSIQSGSIHKSQSVVIRPWDRQEKKQLTPSEKFANSIKKHHVPLLVPVKKIKNGSRNHSSSSSLSLNEKSDNSSKNNSFLPPKHLEVAFDTMSLAPSTTQNPMYKMNRLKIQSENSGLNSSGNSNISRGGSMLSRKKSLSGTSSNYGVKFYKVLQKRELFLEIYMLYFEPFPFLDIRLQQG